MKAGSLKWILISAALCPVSASPAETAAGSTGRGRVIVGTVVAVQPPRVTVRLPNLLGYMRVRVRTYKVRQPALLNGLKPGDRIRGVLLESDGLLHHVRRVADIHDLERPL
jgi:hypothetical protein